jgi:glucose-1-phosphate thymidylyltransferase
MKGVILAGGLGTRLLPMTNVTNKHLLPVYDRPMIYYPIGSLLSAGIDDILVVTGGEHAGDFLKLLKNGRQLGIRHLEYAYQDGEGGIADALKLAEDFVDGDRVCVVLGDNLLQYSVRESAERFIAQDSGCKLLLKQVGDPERFGVVRLERNQVVEIQEKPARPPSDLAVTGVYFYDADVFDICHSLKPSARGELEITDVNNAYIQRGDLSFDVVDGWWTDAGTIPSLFNASQLVADGGANLERGSRSVESFSNQGVAL